MISLEDRTDWEEELKNDSVVFWELYEEQSQTVIGDIIASIIEIHGRPDQMKRAEEIYLEAEKNAKDMRYYHNLD